MNTKTLISKVYDSIDILNKSYESDKILENKKISNDTDNDGWYNPW